MFVPGVEFMKLHRDPFDSFPLGRGKAAQHVVLGAFAINLKEVDDVDAAGIQDVSQRHAWRRHTDWRDVKLPVKESHQGSSDGGRFPLRLMTDDVESRIVHQLQLSAILSHRRSNRLYIVDSIEFDILLQGIHHAGRFDRDNPALFRLRRGPERKHAHISANIDDRVCCANAEPSAIIALMSEDLTNQKGGRATHVRRTAKPQSIRQLETIVNDLRRYAGRGNYAAQVASERISGDEVHGIGSVGRSDVAEAFAAHRRICGTQ